jgi:hypothetical protein
MARMKKGRPIIPDILGEDKALKASIQDRLNEEADIAQLIAMNTQPVYHQNTVPDGQAKIIQQIHEIQPWRFEGEEIVGGHIPPEQFFDFWGFYAPTNSLTFNDEKTIDLSVQDFRIARIARRWARPRSQYDPRRNVDEANTEHLVRMKINQSRDGFARILDATQRTETEQNFRVQKTPSRLKSIYNKMAGKEE